MCTINKFTAHSTTVSPTACIRHPYERPGRLQLAFAAQDPGPDSALHSSSFLFRPLPSGILLDWLFVAPMLSAHHFLWGLSLRAVEAVSDSGQVLECWKWRGQGGDISYVASVYPTERCRVAGCPLAGQASSDHLGMPTRCFHCRCFLL